MRHGTRLADRDTNWSIYRQQCGRRDGGEILDPVADCLTPDVAKRLTELRLNPTTQARIDELAGQANEGLLTPDERVEYADIVEGLDFLGILKAKARSAMARSRR